MPREPWRTGYVLVSIDTKDDDSPARDPREVARDLVDAGVPGVREAETVYYTDNGSYMRYGEASGGGSYTRLDPDYHARS